MLGIIDETRRERHATHISVPGLQSHSQLQLPASWDLHLQCHILYGCYCFVFPLLCLTQFFAHAPGKSSGGGLLTWETRLEHQASGLGLA